MPRLAGQVCYAGLRTLRLGKLSRALRDAGPILCYHNVVASDEPPMGDPGLHLTRERFEKQLRWLASHYTLVSLCDFVDLLTSGGSCRRTAAITFDDGYAGVFENAVPALRALGIPATVFIVVEAVGGAGFWWDAPPIRTESPAGRRRLLDELHGDGNAILPPESRPALRTLPASHRPASWETIRAHTGDGIDIGVHSATHRVLTALTDDELEHEVVASRSAVGRLAEGSSPEFFAYPYGRWDARVRSVVQSAGYRAGLTLDGGLNGKHTNRWSLRRVNVPASITDAAFEVWAAGFRGPWST